MKKFFKLLLITLVFVCASCRDGKKVDAQTKANVEQIETIENEAKEVSEHIEKEAKDLENELNELDKI